jgi:hypothetical protein
LCLAPLLEDPFFTTKRLFYEAAFAYAYLRGLLGLGLAGENSTNWLVLDLWLYILLKYGVLMISKQHFLASAALQAGHGP